MKEFLKAASVERGPALEAGEMALINRQTLRELQPEEVFTFRLAACDNQVDRDNERFSDEALDQMAEKYVGRPVLRDHKWSAGAQTARVYAAQVEEANGIKRLVLRCYLPRTAGTEETIAAIESGVLRECSVGVCCGASVCSICGADQMEALCRHFPGRKYDGKRCYFTLGDICDAYEVSLCAVPSQPAAGTIKSKRYGGELLPDDGMSDRTGTTPRARLLQARLRVAETMSRVGDPDK